MIQARGTLKEGRKSDGEFLLFWPWGVSLEVRKEKYSNGERFEMSPARHYPIPTIVNQNGATDATLW
jgi:hypothetical protein